MRQGEDLGKLLLRLAVAGLMLLHGISKVRHGIGGIVSMVTARGLPAPVAYGVYIGEVIAPLLVLVGVFTRPAALAMAAVMPFAVWLVHGGDVAKLNEHTGGYALELQALYFVGALTIALIGSGRFAARRTRWE